MKLFGKIPARGVVWGVAAVVSGLLFRTAFPPFPGGDGSAWFAPVPLFLAARLLAPRRAAAFGFAWGLAFRLSALSWFFPLSRNGGPLPIVLLGWAGLSAWCALFPALALYAQSTLLAPWRGRRAAAREAARLRDEAAPDSPEELLSEERIAALKTRSARVEPLFPVVAAVLWAGSETLLSRIGGGFAWYGLGAAQARALPIAQLAALGGVPLVSAAVAMLADAMAGVVLRARDGIVRAPGTTRRHFDLTVALALLLVAFSWGSSRLRMLRTDADSAERRLVAAAVNPALPCVFQDAETEWSEGYERLVADTRLAATASPDVVVWPETSLWESMPSPRMEEALCGEAQSLGFPIVAGSTETNVPGADEDTVRNSCWMFGSGGASAPYAKRHLVPFGEFIPLDEHIPILRRLAPAGVSCTPGRTPVHFEIGLSAERGGGIARVSPLICFEDTVPQTAREAAAGADVLVSLSNDAWFGGSCEAAQHQREAVFRAIENGIPLVRASNKGILSAVLPTGEVAPETAGSMMVASVPLAPRRQTRWARLGDWGFGFPCAAALAVVLCLGWRGRRHSRRSSPLPPAPSPN